MNSKEKKKMKKIKYALILAIMLLIISCSMTPKPINMIPSKDNNFSTRFNKTLNVNMTFGGRETDPIIEGSKIDNVSFTLALLMALENSELFDEINSSVNEADFTLKAIILSQDQPLMGLDMTVTLIVKYSLYDNLDKKEIWSEDILSRYTAAFGDALVGMTRLKKANEGSVRQNLRLLLESLSKLKL